MSRWLRHLLFALVWLPLLIRGSQSAEAPEPRPADDSAASVAPGADEVSPSPEAIAFFEKRVRPVLANQCFKCHGPQQQKGGLRLDSREAILAGGDTGPAIVPGKPEESLLIDAVNHGDLVQMPPKGKLSKEDIAALAAWVRGGAPWPRDAGRATQPGGDESVAAIKASVDAAQFTDEQKSFWSFQPPIDPVVPVVANSAWPQSPLDHFILARLEAAGLAPAPAADKRTLIRRATFDLLGLPPTPQEIEAFLADEAPDAFAKVVERLLASPRYGERWGRHWLDVARYADSNGMDENLAFANAYRYRDYVIASFNRDKPYDRFVREQIAGDLLPPAAHEEETLEQMIATGFLTLGPKMLAEDDPVKMEMDIIDEQVDTIGQAFMGLTLGCARCHDHKFDPIPTADYYSLAGIFKSTKTMENFAVVARWQERPMATAQLLAEAEAHGARLAAKKADAEARVQTADRELLSEARRHLADYLLAAAEVVRQNALIGSPIETNSGEPAPGAIVIEAEKFARGNVHVDFENYGPGIGVIYNKGELPNFVEYDIELPQAGLYQLELRYAAAEARPVDLHVNGPLVKSGAAANVTGSWHPDTQRWEAEGVSLFEAGKNVVRLQRAGPFPHFDKLALSKRELPAGVDASQFRSLRQIAEERKLIPAFVAQWARFLADAENAHSSRDASDAPLWSGLIQAIDDPKGPFALPTQAEALYPEETQVQLRQCRAEIGELEKGAPVMPTAMAVCDREVRSLRIHIRGSHLTLGDEVPRRFPRILAGSEQPPLPADHSGRLELAEWLTRADHPLTSRVMINRIWQWHFGEGLVRSSDNFGRLGDRPVHRELLDWLARRFVESGWSLKAMHRLVMLSRTYQMSTANSEQAALVDPDNRLHWRANRRRLEVEALRDSILALGGRLDLTMGGSLLLTKNHEYVTGTASTNATRYDLPRRSVYLSVVRSALYEVFQAFDFAEPSVLVGKRDSTTVAPQALFVLNSPLMLEESRRMAELLLGRAELDDAQRIDLAYQQAFSRPVAADEAGRALAFVDAHTARWQGRGVDSAEARRRAWAGLCRAILGSNEFVYIE